MSLRHVLIVVPEGDPAGLLKPGGCGGSPPWAWWCLTEWLAGDRAVPASDVAPRLALPLVFEGEPLEDGIHRAESTLRRLVGAPPDMRFHWFRVGTAADVALTWAPDGAMRSWRIRIPSPPDFKWWTLLGLALSLKADGYRLVVVE